MKTSRKIGNVYPPFVLLDQLNPETNEVFPLAYVLVEKGMNFVTREETEGMPNESYCDIQLVLGSQCILGFHLFHTVRNLGINRLDFF